MVSIKGAGFGVVFALLEEVAVGDEAGVAEHIKRAANFLGGGVEENAHVVDGEHAVVEQEVNGEDVPGVVRIERSDYGADERCGVVHGESLGGGQETKGGPKNVCWAGRTEARSEHQNERLETAPAMPQLSTSSQAVECDTVEVVRK
jgi:hypothetical protein